MTFSKEHCSVMEKHLIWDLLSGVLCLQLTLTLVEH